MEFVVIFAKDNPVLFALKKVGGKTDVFTKLFQDWGNPANLLKFFEKHKSDLNNWNLEGDIIDGSVNFVMEHAEELHLKINRLTFNYIENNSEIRLDSMFKDLHDKNDGIVELRESKAKSINGPDWLRVYGIRIEKNCYLITGGMIKLIKPMTSKEGKAQLNTIHRVRDFLKNNNIKTRENLIQYINEKRN